MVDRHQIAIPEIAIPAGARCLGTIGYRALACCLRMIFFVNLPRLAIQGLRSKVCDPSLGLAIQVQGRLFPHHAAGEREWNE
jgi:hypothetical protein